jgi:hypothetical protein
VVWIQPLTTAVFAILGILAGATLQYFYGQRGEAWKAHRQLRSAAYLDLIKAVVGTAAQRNVGGLDAVQIFSALADAKARICVYGSSAVIHAISEHLRRFHVLDSAESCVAFTGVLQAMRDDAGFTDHANDADLLRLLFGDDLPRSS